MSENAKLDQKQQLSNAFKGIVTKKNYLYVEEQFQISNNLRSKDNILSTFVKYAGQRFTELSKTIIGDYSYKSKNAYTFSQKKKILKYLKTKYLTTSVELQDSKKIKFTEYDPEFFDKKVEDYELRDFLLKGKSIIEAAEDNLKKIEFSKKQLQARFLNEAAYQFDKQRYCSMLWGLTIAAFICSTIYRKGSTTRKAALFLSCGHIFGQVSYLINIDQYFDAVYQIYERQATNFAFEEFKRQKEQKIGGKTEYID